MRFPSLKSSAYTNLSLEEKIKYVKDCCENRKALLKKFNSTLFGNKPSIYLSTLTAMSDYLDAALKNNLDDCYKKGFKKYIDYRFSHHPPRSSANIIEMIFEPLWEDEEENDANYRAHCNIMNHWDNIKANPINENDLETAYKIANQCFLSNEEFYHFAFDELQKLEKSDQLSFYLYLYGTIYDERVQWSNRFPQSHGFKDLPSEKIRPAIKTTAIATFGMALAAGATGTLPLALILAASASTLYGTSGELADTIAAKFYSKEENSVTLRR